MSISRRAALFGGLAGGLGAAFGGLARAGDLSYEYDALGRLIKATYPDGAFVTYAYDAAGNRTQRRQAPWGSTFTATIQITGSGPVDLRTLANTAGYSGFDAIITFEVGNGVSIMGAPGAAGASSEDGGVGGAGITTGTWPSGQSIALTITVKSGGSVRGGGGGGAGGDYAIYSSTGGYGGGDQVPGNGGAGGAAISCTVPATINVQSGGLVAGGGDGGAGGLGFEEMITGGAMIDYGWYDGGGGGGGYPNGAGGAGGFGVPAYPGYFYAANDVGSPGGDGTTSGGGAGGLGGHWGAQNPSTATYATNGSGAGSGGYAIAKNGQSVTVSNSGTITGSIV